MRFKNVGQSLNSSVHLNDKFTFAVYGIFKKRSNIVPISYGVRFWCICYNYYYSVNGVDFIGCCDFKFQFIIVHFIPMKSLFRIFTKFSVCNGCTPRIDDLSTTNSSSYFSSLSCAIHIGFVWNTIHVHTDAALISRTICV